MSNRHWKSWKPKPYALCSSPGCSSWRYTAGIKEGQTCRKCGTLWPTDTDTVQDNTSKQAQLLQLVVALGGTEDKAKELVGTLCPKPPEPVKNDPHGDVAKAHLRKKALDHKLNQELEVIDKLLEKVSAAYKRVDVLVKECDEADEQIRTAEALDKGAPKQEVKQEAKPEEALTIMLGTTEGDLSGDLLEAHKQATEAINASIATFKTLLDKHAPEPPDKKARTAEAAPADGGAGGGTSGPGAGSAADMAVDEEGFALYNLTGLTGKQRQERILAMRRHFRAQAE